MAKIPDGIKEEVRSRLDIIAVAERYMALKRSGANNFGKCPFPGHAEKTGSFNVNSARQRYHCFGCGEDGDVFELVAQIEGLSFPEAVKKLAAEVGIEIREEQHSQQDKQREREREWAFEINSKALSFFQSELTGDDGQLGRDYLAKRGVTDEMVAEYSLGFCSMSWDSLVSHLMSNKQSSKLCEALGLIKRSDRNHKFYDRLRGRIVLPIYSHDGKLVSFSGIAVDDSIKPSFVDLPDSPIFKQEYHLFGFFQGKEAIRQAECAIVVRRHLDLFALKRAGFNNVVVACGGVIQEGHVRTLKRVAKKVIILTATDVDSLKSAFNSLDAFLPQQLSVAYAFLEERQSPGYFVAQQGAEKLKSLLEASRPGLEAYMEKVIEISPETRDGRSKAAHKVIAKMKLIPNDIERSLYAQELSRLTGVQLGWIMKQSNL